MALRLAFTRLRTAASARLLPASAASSSALRSVNAYPHQIAHPSQRRCLTTGSGHVNSSGPLRTTGPTRPEPASSASDSDASTTSASTSTTNNDSASASTFATELAKKRAKFAAHFNDAHFRDALRGLMQFYYRKPAPQQVGVMGTFVSLSVLMLPSMCVVVFAFWLIYLEEAEFYAAIEAAAKAEAGMAEVAPELPSLAPVALTDSDRWPGGRGYRRLLYRAHATCERGTTGTCACRIGAT